MISPQVFLAQKIFQSDAYVDKSHLNGAMLWLSLFLQSAPGNHCPRGIEWIISMNFPSSVSKSDLMNQ